MKNLNTGVTVKSDLPIDFINEQIIPEWGLSVTVESSESSGSGSCSFGVEWGRK